MPVGYVVLVCLPTRGLSSIRKLFWQVFCVLWCVCGAKGAESNSSIPAVASAVGLTECSCSAFHPFARIQLG